MTFLAPGFVVASAVVAALVIGLHFLVTRQPPSAALPTARFIPAASTTIVAAARRPHDLLLLLVRVALIALVGAAFARPQLSSRRSPVLRIVVADRSRNVGDMASVRDSVERLLRGGDLLVVFDSAARAVPSAQASDTVGSLQRATTRGVLSSALIVARRAAARSRDRADSLELDIVSPLTDDEIDAATAAVRALWSGRIRVVSVAATRDSNGPPAVVFRGASDDPLRAAHVWVSEHAAGDGPRAAAADSVRLVRDRPTAADSAWARSGHGHVLVAWPAAGVTPSWPARGAVDTAGGVVVFGPTPAAVVAAFPRSWRLEASADSHVHARWLDGEPAVMEHALGLGCVRDVAVVVPSRGDLVLRPEFTRLVSTVVEPCGGARGAGTPASSDHLAMIAGTGPLMAARTIEPAEGADAPVVPWIFAAALMLVVIEGLARGARASPTDHPNAGSVRA